MYIAIATLTFNLDGYLFFKAGPGTSLFNLNRRVSRTQTLDGGVFLDDRGFTHGDRSLSIVATLTRDEFDRIREISQNYGSIRVSFIDGVYVGSIVSVSINNQLLTEIQILISAAY